MKINDLEKLTGLKRSNIFYYEREGLITPRREDNNYREYTEEDLRRLKAIVVFRKLGFTVAEIKELLDGERELIDVLPENMARLRDQTEELAAAMTLCRDMERQGLTMESFDPDAWFEIIESEERQGVHFMDMLGDVADDFTKTVAFVQDSIGLRGPVYAYFFLSEEGIRKRRLWKLYWALCLGGYLLLLAEPYLLPGHYIRLASPWAALVYTLVQGVIGSLVLVLCARYIIPGRKPRQALWLTIAIVVGVNLCLRVLSQQAYRTEIDEEAQAQWQQSVGQYFYEGDDPAGYVQREYNEKYWGGAAALDVYETEGLTLVLTSRGRTFFFLRNEDGSWTERSVSAPVNGMLYTADPYGPEPYPSRLMLSDGTVAEPVYEARFDTGYVPVFAFPAGQSCRGILYGVDENGGLHYELRTKYAIAPEHTLGAYYNQPGYFNQYSLASVWRTADGPAFLAAWKTFRGELWRAEPDVALDDSTSLWVDSAYILWADSIAPPSLVVSADAIVPDDWGLNEYGEVLYLRDESTTAYPKLMGEGWQYRWNQSCWADITALVTAETVTPELLRAAAQSARGMGEIGGFAVNSVPYAAVRTWNGVTVPEELLALVRAVRSELGG